MWLLSEVAGAVMAEIIANGKKNMRRFLFSAAIGIMVAATCRLAHAETIDTLVSVSPNGTLKFVTLESAVLANVILPEPETATSFLSSLTGHRMRYKTLSVDRYGRTPIIVVDGDDTLTVQQQMLRQGIAIAYTTTSAAKTPDWTNDEAMARDAHRGYWVKGEHQLTPEQAASAIGTFALVRGTVTNLYHARNADYLNFGENWQDDFSIKIPHTLQLVLDRIEKQLLPSADAKTPRFTSNPEVPVTLQVRGTVIAENGPMIVVTKPDQLEMVANAKPK
ncbi:MAG: hypothetical protein B7X02_00615 [Rhodospirillales bacterium 12-54-5]|nr:MAG: hypothetical protein B7X02_00615 [Rhodospirillales bacterium 12-54-5]